LVLLVVAGVVSATALGSGSTIGALLTTTTSTTVPESPPGAPTLVSATAGPDGVALRWTPPVGATPDLIYRVERGTASGQETGIYGTYDTQYFDTSTEKGTKYVYTISAYNGLVGPESNELAVTATGPNVQPLFDPYDFYGSAKAPLAVAIGDVTGDGRADIVLTTGYGGTANDFHLFVYAQNADGTLAVPVIYATMGTYPDPPASVAVGDITGDGRADVVVGIRDVGVQVFPQLAGGGLGTPALTSTYHAYKIRLGQLDGDGRLDVAGVGFGANTVSVMLNNGLGGLRAPVHYTAPHDGYEDFEIADVTSDGRDDLVVMSGEGLVPNVSVLAQLAAGGFAAPASYSVATGKLTNAIGVGDVTGDGRKDVVAVQGFNGAYVSVFAQTPSAALASPVNYGAYDFPEAVDVADLDLDGRNDVFVVHTSGAGLYRQRADGTLSAEETFPIPGSQIDPHGLAVGDINGDRSPDVVIASQSYGLVVLRNTAPPAGSTTPDAPTLTSAVAGKASVTITWTPPSSNGGAAITGYRIYRGTSAGGETYQRTLSDPTAATFTEEVAPGTTYYYEVTAVNGVGEGGTSNELSVRPDDANPPDAPNLIEANVGYDLVYLDWNAPASDGGATITSYRIYRGTAAGAETLLDTVYGDSTSFPDYGANGGTTYYYRVTAVNIVGEGAPSNERSATPLTPTVPDPPTLTAATGDYSGVRLAWKSNFDGGWPIWGYKIYRGTASGGEELIASLDGNWTSYTDTTGDHGTTYYYEVTAFNGVGESGRSNELAAASLTPRVPDPPTLAAAATYSKVHLTWTTGSSGGVPITGYKLYRGTTSGGEALLATIGSGTNFYDDTSGTNGTKYYYELTALNSVGESGYSGEVSATPVAPTRPSAPNLWQATAGYSSVTLQWDPPTSTGGVAITGYRIYRGTASGGETVLTTLGNTLSYTDTSGVNGTIYYYKVSALNSGGESVLSNERSASPIRRLFDPYGVTWIGSSPEAVAIGDVTGDGRNDVVATTSFYFDDANDYHVFVLAQRADGTLAPPVSYLTAATYTNRPKSVAIGDITGDGKADVVIGLVGLGVQVFPQLASGTLGTPTLTSSTDVGVIRLGQLDGDGRLDVANAGGAVSVFLNDDQGGLRQPVRYAASGSDLEVADVTNDGRDDLVALSGQSVSVLPQLAVGGFGAPVVYPTGANSWGTHAIGAGDVNGDGRADVVVTYGGNTPTTFVAVLAQGAGGTLGAPTAYPTLDSPEAVDAADLDLDGLTDVAVLHGGTVSSGVHRQGPGGSLLAEERYSIPSSSHYDVHGLAVGDVSGDGTPDLVAAGFTTGVTVLRNTTAPSAAPGAPTLTGAIADKAGINLTWNPPASQGGASSGYRIYRGTAAGGETLLATLGTARSFADNTAVAGKTYWYQVSAFNPRGESARSAERSAAIPNPDAIAPTAPGSPKMVVAGTNQLALDWSPSTDNVGVTGYNVYRNNGLVATTPSTQYLDGGLAPGTNYTYVIRAVDAAGNTSAASSSVTAKTAATATGSTGTLAGAVYDSTGKPLANAVVSAAGKTAKTNASGTWKISNLKAGTYTESVSLAGYRTQTASVALVGGKTVLSVFALST
jgi:fibronectin type 3 domain-containing protein